MSYVRTIVRYMPDIFNQKSCEERNLKQYVV